MSEHVKARILDIVFVIIVGLIVLYGYDAFSRIRAHARMDDQLIDILSAQAESQKRDLEQRCVAAGFTKLEESDGSDSRSDR